MAITKSEIRSDIILRLTQGKPSSDFEVPDAQIDRWIDMARDRVVAEYVFKSAKYDGRFIDPTYIKTETVSPLTGVTGLQTAVITEPILSTPLNDSALIRVMVTSTSGSSTVRASKVDLFQLSNLEAMEYTAPSASKPVVYRKENTLYFKGLPNAVTDYSVEVDYVQAMVGSSTDYSVSEAHLEAITEMAENIGKRELGIMIVDDVNDGNQNRDNTQQTIRR